VQVMPVVTPPRTPNDRHCIVHSDRFQLEPRLCGDQIQVAKEMQAGGVQVASHMQACILLRQPDRLMVRNSKAHAALPKHLT
jgi:hypothetical protein